MYLNRYTYLIFDRIDQESDSALTPAGRSDDWSLWDGSDDQQGQAVECQQRQAKQKREKAIGKAYFTSSCRKSVKTALMKSNSDFMTCQSLEKFPWFTESPVHPARLPPTFASHKESIEFSSNYDHTEHEHSWPFVKNTAFTAANLFQWPPLACAPRDGLLWPLTRR